MIIRNNSVAIKSVKSKIDAPVDIVVLGDSHDNPERSKDRFIWIGKYLNENMPDKLISIGDFMTLDSLSQHQLAGSYEDLTRTSFSEDKDSCEEALYLLDKAIGNNSLKKYITLGNHEYRAGRLAKQKPKECGQYYNEVKAIFENRNFNITEYGEYLSIENVDFTHMPFNGRNVPYSGNTSEATIAKGLISSCVFGHTHKFKYLTEPKIGKNISLTILNVGTSLPDGVVEEYAGLSLTGWTYGIVRLTVLDGKIYDHQHISMKTLERRYGV